MQTVERPRYHSQSAVDPVCRCARYLWYDYIRSSGLPRTVGEIMSLLETPVRPLTLAFKIWQQVKGTRTQ